MNAAIPADHDLLAFFRGSRGFSIRLCLGFFYSRIKGSWSNADWLQADDISLLMGGGSCWVFNFVRLTRMAMRWTGF
jgi:hypothetical protein